MSNERPMPYLMLGITIGVALLALARYLVVLSH